MVAFAVKGVFLEIPNVVNSETINKKVWKSGCSNSKLVEKLEDVFKKTDKMSLPDLGSVLDLYLASNDSEGKSSYEPERIDHAKIMKPFILRRVKNDVLEELPAKTVIIKKCPKTAKRVCKLLRAHPME